MLSTITTITTATVIGVAVSDAEMTNTTSPNTQTEQYITAVQTPKQTVPENQQNTLVYHNDTAEPAINQLTTTSIPTISNTPEIEGITWVQDSTKTPQINTKQVAYTIKRTSTLTELESIQKAAEAAGIDFNFTAKVRSNELKKLRLKAQLKGPGHECDVFYYSGNFPKESDYEMVIGWTVNEEGKATSLGVSDNEMSEHNFDIQINEIEFHLGELLDELSEINDDVNADLKELLDDLEVDLAELNEESLAILENLDFSGMKEILIELDDETEKMLREVGLQIEELLKEKENAKKAENPDE